MILQWNDHKTVKILFYLFYKSFLYNFFIFPIIIGNCDYLVGAIQSCNEQSNATLIIVIFSLTQFLLFVFSLKQDLPINFNNQFQYKLKTGKMAKVTFKKDEKAQPPGVCKGSGLGGGSVRLCDDDDDDL